MLNKKFASALSLAAYLVACTTPSEDDHLVGGFGEETNTIAGVLRGADGSPVGGAVVLARHMSAGSIVVSDTTDEDGNFGMYLERRGFYAVSSVIDSEAVYKTVDFEGTIIELKLDLSKTVDFKGRVVLESGIKPEGVTVSLPGSMWSVETDAKGDFEFNGIPSTAQFVQVSSPDPIRYENSIYALDFVDSAVKFLGPLPSSMMYEMDDVDLSEAFDSLGVVEENLFQLPVSSEYGLLSWWSMDYLWDSEGSKVAMDARGRMGSLVIYGVEDLEKGLDGMALHLKSVDQFGVIESDQGALDSVSELTFEVLAMFDSVGEDEPFRRNIVGKLGFGDEDVKNVFSFALVNKECGVESPSVAFFLADGSGDSLSCANAVVASAPVEYGTWVNYVVTWDGKNLNLYKDGSLDAEMPVSVGVIQPSDEPIFFGKENVNVKLDDVRLGAKAITSADVLYRYYLRGRSL